MRRPNPSIRAPDRDAPQRATTHALAMSVLVSAIAVDPACGVGGIFAECKVIDHLKDRPVVMLQAGRNQGVAPGDRTVLLADGELAATARVFYVEPDLCAVRIGWRRSDLDSMNTAVVVSQTLPSVCRIAMPRGTTVSASIDDVAPGHRTVWLDQGRNAGLRLGDGMMVGRAGATIARAEIVEVYRDYALARLTRLSPSASTRTGDRVRLWPTPAERRSGQVHLPVLLAEDNGDDQYVWLPGGAADGLNPDRRIELFRGDDYVATAILDQPGVSLSRARTVQAYCRQRVRTGDQAVLLGTAAAGSEAVGRIFRIDKDYCLVSAGEDVGLERGQRLYVTRDGRPVATLAIQTVKETYCGADLVPAGTGSADRPRAWDRVFSQPPRRRTVRDLGTIGVITLCGQFASVVGRDAGRHVEPGTLVSIQQDGQTAAAGMVVCRSQSGIILYVPICWRDASLPVGAQVLYSQAP